ncbi:MAG TPA: hypothetical protein VGN12_19590 [Pirellulales bacterium]|jgi:DNA-directed RNA polymerase specialized sigma24 family protein
MSLNANVGSHLRDRLIRVARRQLPKMTVYDCEDAAHDVIVMALVADIAAKTDCKRGTLESLYTGVVRNQCRMGRRKYMRGNEHLREDLADQPLDPARETMRRELRGFVRRAVRQLAVPLRQAIYAKFGTMGDDDDLPPSASTGRGSTPYVRLNRAKLRLFEMLQGLSASIHPV